MKQPASLAVIFLLTACANVPEQHAQQPLPGTNANSLCGDSAPGVTKACYFQHVPMQSGEGLDTSHPPVVRI